MPNAMISSFTTLSSLVVYERQSMTIARHCDSRTRPPKSLKSALDHEPRFPRLMSALNFNAITENASRFGSRLQETISEHTRELTIAHGVNANYFDTPEEKVKNIRKQLDSNSDREKLDAMKRLIAVRLKLVDLLTTCSYEMFAK